ncbi:MAG TPA: glycosyltransferase family 2 protein [Opitutaceae bacterium]|nr:glycosyltransferase family 2 protein [Opitutaceae bacterium]
MSAPVTCSVVIATVDRPASLRVVLDCLARQTRPPLEVIIVPAGAPPEVPEKAGGPVRILRGAESGAARQRNAGAAGARGEVIAFLDDDIEFGPDLFARVLAHFDESPASALGALSPRLTDLGRAGPGRLARWYYSLQAGYADRDFGGRLFGPGINCFPVYGESGPERCPADWLPATCLFVRAELFRRHRFPAFTGYSFAEDVHLTARIAREAPVFFLREPAVRHHSLPAAYKRDRAALAAGKLENMAVVAREAMGLAGWPLRWRWHLHRLFVATALLLRRPEGWGDEIRGIWRARL